MRRLKQRTTQSHTRSNTQFNTRAYETIIIEAKIQQTKNKSIRGQKTVGKQEITKHMFNRIRSTRETNGQLGI